jgi:hypothetical protein
MLDGCEHGSDQHDRLTTALIVSVILAGKAAKP